MLKIALVCAELEENLGPRYMTSALDPEKHRVEIVPFNTGKDTLSHSSKLTKEVKKRVKKKSKLQ